MKALENRLANAALIITICLFSASCEVMLYPLARAFGSPSEAELKVFRENFLLLQKEISTSKMAVFPPSIVNDQKQEWKSEVAKQIRGIVQTKMAVDAYEIVSNPELEFMPVGRNQSSFRWDRARAYSAWVIQAQPVPAGDFIMFTDFICTPDSNCKHVGGVNVYVTDSQGRIAYTTVINSKHGLFQRYRPDSLSDCAFMAVERFREGLSMDVMDLYPPYGVG